MKTKIYCQLPSITPDVSSKKSSSKEELRKRASGCGAFQPLLRMDTLFCMDLRGSAPAQPQITAASARQLSEGPGRESSHPENPFRSKDGEEPTLSSQQPNKIG